MTYEILKDFKDDDYNLDLHVGDEAFVPAKINYPADRIAKRVADGSLKLLTKLAPHGTVVDETAEVAAPSGGQLEAPPEGNDQPPSADPFASPFVPPVGR